MAEHYSFMKPKLCGYYRTAIYLIASGKKLIENRDDADDSGYNTSQDTVLSEHLLNITPDEPLDITFEVENSTNTTVNCSTPKVKKSAVAKQPISVRDGLETMKQIFGHHFESNKIELSKLQKTISRFTQFNKKWARDDNTQKTVYYEYFSPEKWLKLSSQNKNKHQVTCDECNNINTPVFPSTTKRFLKEKK